MNNDEKAVIFYDSFNFATYKKKERLFSLFNPSNLIDLDFVKENKDTVLNIFTQEEFDIICNNLVSNSIDKIIENLDKLKIDTITVYSKEYPITLKNIDTPPFVLYYKGDINLLKSNCFAIVGSRHITNYGKQVTEKFTADLVKANFVIVSGLASGVDTVAHSVTLQNKGKTIAVLAGGLDEIYPATNTQLAENIVRNGGLLITETKPYKKTESYMFPIRNRIISGLSRGILVTEAQEKSGVLHTKNYALDYGRDVFAVPGSIFSLQSVGTNQMIVNAQAKAVVCAQDILEEYNIKLNIKNQKSYNVSLEERLVLDVLQNEPKTFQQIVDTTKIEVKTLNSLLTTLLIRGIIKKLAGNVYYLAD